MRKMTPNNVYPSVQPYFTYLLIRWRKDVCFHAPSTPMQTIQPGNAKPSAIPLHSSSKTHLLRLALILALLSLTSMAIPHL